MYRLAPGNAGRHCWQVDHTPFTQSRWPRRQMFSAPRLESVVTSQGSGAVPGRQAQPARTSSGRQR